MKNYFFFVPEKSMVMDMIMSAISSNEEYKTQNGDQPAAPKMFLETGKMIGTDNADRSVNLSTPPPLYLLEKDIHQHKI